MIKYTFPAREKKKKKKKKKKKHCEVYAVPVTLTLSVPETKSAGFANSVVLDEVAHHESPHLDIHCLSFSLRILNMK